VGAVRNLDIGYNTRMGFFLADPEIERLPPSETRLLDLQAEPYPNGNLLRVTFQLTPYQQGPTLDLILTNSAGKIVSSASIVEPVVCNLEINLHILKAHETTGGLYRLTGVLSFPELGEVDRKEIVIELPLPKVQNVISL
jgi:hypothetical protein